MSFNTRGRGAARLSAMNLTRWGIVGPGRIARTFAEDLRLVPDAELAGVGSRSLERATAFAQEYGGRAYGSYAELFADDTVDAVYVALPHALHVEQVAAALEAGKHVLCEKPLTLRATDAEALFALAVGRERLLMEAMWTACHPAVRAVRQRLRDGEFGTPRHLHAEPDVEDVALGVVAHYHPAGVARQPLRRSRGYAELRIAAAMPSSRLCGDEPGGSRRRGRSGGVALRIVTGLRER